MSLDEETNDARSAGLLAVAALVIYVAALFLPLHLIGRGVFESAFPQGVGTRLTVGFLIRDFTVPLVIVTGLLLITRGRVSLAAGVFLGAGLFSILEGVTRPFYERARTRPLILMSIQILAGALLLLAALRVVVLKAPPLPPPP